MLCFGPGRPRGVLLLGPDKSRHAIGARCATAAHGPNGAAGTGWPRRAPGCAMITERIASLLASATEILYGLGLGDRVVAVSHECDWPGEVAGKPRVTRTRI